jgi:diguanylate cyclase (GGDEF)-like protein/PAS domain S-box-containing protein
MRLPTPASVFLRGRCTVSVGASGDMALAPCLSGATWTAVALVPLSNPVLAADASGLVHLPLLSAPVLGGIAIALGLLLIWRTAIRLGARASTDTAAQDRFRAAVELSPDAILVHSGGRFVYANHSAVELLRASGPSQIVGMETLDIVHPDYREQERRRIEQMRQGLPVAPEEQRFLRFDGSAVEVEVTASPFRYRNHFSVQVFVRDITERKQAEPKLKRLTNLYCALSETSHAVSRFQERGSLLQESCRIAVEFGRLQTTWIGMVDEAQRRVVPVAAFGPGEAYARQVFISTDESRPEGRGPIGIAMREGRAGIVRDFDADPRMMPWRDAARRYGLRSVAVFPLRQDGRVVGAIMHYADEVGFFDDELVGLLERMAGEIGFALDSFESSRKWLAAEAALLETQREMETLLGNLPGMAYRSRYDDRWTMEFVSEGCLELTGYAPEDLQFNRLVSYEDITHPEDRARVRAEVGRAAASRSRFTVEYRLIERGGKEKWVSEKGLAFYSDSGKPVALEGFISDITEVKSYRERLEHQASHDALTGLANRDLLHDRLRQAIARAERQQHGVAVAFLDLDNFKYLNDSLGHSAGDELLKIVAHRLRTCVREGDTVARLGGDEFVLVLVDQSGAEAVSQVVRRVLEKASEPYFLAGRELNTSASLGVSLYPQDGTDAETLLKNADAAMYRAKAQGRNNFYFFTAEINASLHERMALEHGLRQALERGEFLLDYQPKVELASGFLIGAEALVRWMHPEHGLLSPARFIPVAEETGLIVPVGEWILRAACTQAQRWRSQGLDLSLLSVNISARQFRSPNLVDQIAGALSESGLPGGCLDLEITESLMMEDVQEFIARLRTLKELGVQLSVDDFGTGYSSLNYLKQFPVDRLKIDRSFVCDIATDPGDAAIVQAVIQLGHVLGLAVTAEGVETGEQLAFLRRHGCDEGQGYYFSKPLKPAQFEQLLRAQGTADEAAPRAERLKATTGRA